VSKWDRRFLDLAAHVAEWSKDPSTRCGAVIVDDRRRVVSVGYNGFARGVRDDAARLADREVKYRLVAHAEVNAVLTAGRDLTGCTLYTHPFGTCDRCAAQVIQAGIRRVVSPYTDNDRWAGGIALAALQYREAGVEFDVVKDGVVYPGWSLYPLHDVPTPAPVRGGRSFVIPGQGESDL
jgi:dCMP deaminase